VSRLDHRGCTVSGAEPAALEAFERALAAYQGWRDGAEAPLALALEEAPRFVMAHVLQAYLLVCSRDPRRLAMARPTLARAAALPANERERLHVAAIAALLDDDDFEAARATLGELLRLEPRDALALQAAHSLDYVSGDAQCMKERVATVLPAWSKDLPGYHAILAMHAFSLEESGRYDGGRGECARRARPRPARCARASRHGPRVRDDRPPGGRRELARRPCRGLGQRHRRRNALLVAPRPVPACARPA
jgi:tetratricopeptide (TPR) repeat protein